MVDFQPFINTNRLRNTKDGYSISWRVKDGKYRQGQINFNGGMRDKLSLTDYSKVETFRDDKQKLVALRFNNDEISGSNRSLRFNGNSRFMTSVSFAELAVVKYGYPTGRNLPYRRLDNGLVVLLKELATPKSNQRMEEE